MMKKHIPNLISLLNSFFGSLSIYYALVYSNIEASIICMLIAAGLDFFDGFAARKLQVFSPLGKDIDSLADVISFGVAPAAMMAIALDSIGFKLSILALVIVPFSVYRLAKFNNDVRQVHSFIGLPTPANAMFFAGLSYFTVTNTLTITNVPITILYKIYAAYIIVILLMSWLLISEIPMFSLKSADGDKRHWHKVATVLIFGVVGVIFWSYSGFAIALTVYLIINLWSHLRHRIP